jgi:HEAT repeat protein
LLALLPRSAHADLASEVLDCKSIDFQTCPALLKAAASRTDPSKALAAVLGDAAQPAERRARAALALSLLDAKEQLPAFVAAAASLAGKPERVDILTAQARLGDTRAAEPLLDILQHDATARGKTLAAGALGLLRHKPAVPLLIGLLKAEDQPRLQAEAAHALGLIADSTAVPELLAMAARPRLYVPARMQAMDALAALRAASAVPLATQLVDAPARDVGRAALHLLAAVPTPWTEPVVLFALDTPGLRGEAARVVVAMNLKSAGDKLIAAAVRDDLEPHERVYVLHALGKIQPAGAGPALLKRLAVAPDPEKVQILHALPKVGDRTVVPELIALLHEAGPSANQQEALANHVIFALENLTGKNLGPDEQAWRAYAGLDTPDAGATTKP